MVVHQYDLLTAEMMEKLSVLTRGRAWAWWSYPDLPTRPWHLPVSAAEGLVHFHVVVRTCSVGAHLLFPFSEAFLNTASRIEQDALIDRVVQEVLRTCASICKL
jgi:hypothetical protein